MKVLLFQLPIQTHDFFFSNENIPLAPAYLQIIASDLGIDAELLPGHVMRYGSDQAILRSILDAKPDIVGMSCYLWNLERSLFLSGQIKRRLPECRVVLGGPEVTLVTPFFFDIRASIWALWERAKRSGVNSFNPSLTRPGYPGSF